MATGKSGSYEILNGCYIVKVDWSETYDIASNTSELSVNISAKSSDWYGWQYYLSGDISVDGTPVVAFDSTVWTHLISIPSQNTYYGVTTKDGYAKPPWKVTIPHNTDGTKQVTIALAFNGWTGDYPDHISCFDARTIELTSIPRASTIGATNANIGAVSMIAVNRKSTAYTHSIQYVFGAVSGYVTADGGTSDSEVKFGNTSVPFTLPASFYSQIPKAKAGIGSLICRTYSGSTQIGDAQTATFTASAAEADCAPIVSGTVVDSNETTKALTGDANVLVRYYSTALCTIDATARNSASITAKAIGGVTVSGDTRSIANIESGSVTFSATDSRGYTTTPPPVMKSLVPYIRLTNNPAVARPEPTTGRAILTLKGDYFKGSFGAVENTLAAQYRIDGGDPVDIPVEITDNSYTASVELTGMDYMRSFQFEVVVTDKLSSVSKKTTLLRGIPVFDWGETDFNFNVPAAAPAPTSAEHLINLGYAKSLFAPAGYGLGGQTMGNDIWGVADLDNHAANGWYYLSCMGESIDGYRFNGAIVRISNATLTGAVMQEVFPLNTNYCVRRIRNTDGVWQPWEWENPPMVPGVLYRTTKRYMGRPIYTFCMSVGTLPNNSSKTLTLGGTCIDRLLSVSGAGSAYGTYNGAVYNDEHPLDKLVSLINVARRGNDTHIVVRTDTDRSVFDAVITIEFLREGD